jgi:hypothetical protein
MAITTIREIPSNEPESLCGAGPRPEPYTGTLEALYRALRSGTLAQHRVGTAAEISPGDQLRRPAIECGNWVNIIAQDTHPQMSHLTLGESAIRLIFRPDIFAAFRDILETLLSRTVRGTAL